MPAANINLPVSRLVNVGVVLSPAGAQAPQLNTGLVLGTSTVIDVVSRMRTYLTLAAVATDFGTSAQEYLAAQAWFGQTPQPTSLNIGRWAQAASAGQLFCAPLSAANSLVSAWTGITTGKIQLSVNGVGPSVTGNINFTGATTLAGIAALIQTAIQAIGGGFAAATCTYDPVFNRFIITSGTTGTSSTISFLTAPGSGTDITAMMGGLVTSSGAYVANGIAAETALAAVVIFDNLFGGQWYNLFIPSAADSDATAIAPYIDGDATPHFFWFNSQETAMLASGDTTHIGYLLQQLLSQHAAVQYSSQSLYAVWSMAARIATVNWSGSNTAISLMYKQEPGITPETLNGTQITALESYNVNVFVTYANGTSIIEQGICPSGQFIDTIIGIDWLRTQIQTNIYNLLFQSTTKIPQTDAGVTTLESGVTAACEQGIINGLGAPGTWNSGGFGQLVQGQFLDQGYYIYAIPVAQQSQSQRQARQSPPIQVAFKLAGAIDDVSVVVNVNS
jgi:hypothetical protein